MFASHALRSSLRRIAVLAFVVVASCGKDSTGPGEEEPRVTQMRIAFGGSSYTFSGAAGENRSVRVPLGATAVSVQWLRADGTVDPVATSPTFTLKVTSGAGITFANSSTQPFSGTLTIASTVTNVPVQFGLFHVAEGHEDFGQIINISAP